MPAGAFVSPEAGMPDKHFLPDGSHHDENQSDCRELSEHAECYSKTAGYFGYAKKDGERFAHADALASSLWVGEVAPAAGNENYRDHESQKQQADICELE